MPCYGHSWMKIPILNQVLMNPEGMDWFRFQGQWKEPGPLADHKCSSPFRLASLADRKYFSPFRLASLADRRYFSKLRLASLANFVCAFKFFLQIVVTPSKDYGGADAEKKLSRNTNPTASARHRCYKVLQGYWFAIRRIPTGRPFSNLRYFFGVSLTRTNAYGATEAKNPTKK